MMPKLDGLGLARMLKTRGFHIPIIFLTALDKPVDRLEGLEVGAIDYLSKPVELKELSLKIKNLLDVTNSVHKKQDWEVPAPIHTIATACDHP
jgi:DNA-binding response OmpR family regulator